MENESQTTEKRSRTKSILAALVVIVLVAAAAVAVYVFRNELFDRDAASAYTDIEPYTYEAGADQSFALSNDGLAVASSTGLQLMRADGATIAKSIFSMSVPAVSCADTGAAVFYDIGGTAVRAVSAKGAITDLDSSQRVISARMGSSGAVAVCTEETGYKGLATLYDSSFSAVYRWYSGSAWLLCAAPSPNGRMLAALCAGDDGAEVHLFSRSSETEQALFSLPGEFCFDVVWLSPSTLCVVGENLLVFCNTSGEELSRWEYRGEYLKNYCAGGGCIAVFTGKYLTGGSGTLTILDSAGSALGSLTTDRSLVSLSCGERRLLALYTDGLTLYSETCEIITEDTDVLGTKAALLLSDGDALLLSSYSAERRSLR